MSKTPHQVAGYVSPDVYDQINAVCTTTGVSRSEFVAAACAERLSATKPRGAFDLSKVISHLSEALKELLKANKKS